MHPEFGNFVHDAICNLWSTPKEHFGYIVSGRSSEPTRHQGKLFSEFCARQVEILDECYRVWGPPFYLPSATRPEDLTIHEIRFEANNQTLIFFDPTLITKDGYEVGFTVYFDCEFRFIESQWNV